ncbi:DoxX family protein [Dyadobacter sp. CY326]|uniref:DoxX family protein n=1 Tax=Dyadobacter sp. CY326 TaxID=2907300 RepID=UPI001F2A569F|nr:DoxX family protein [Dyadobacter sp. CY326]MCE7068423.1 DoxX family protein [Dyadobacter sp. CY326]
MKTTRIIFWIATTLIFLFEGVMPALTSQTQMAVDGIRHLGYPDYFGPMITAFKVAGALALILPKFPARLKEWAYAGFVFDFFCASISVTVVDGFGFGSIFPLIVLAVLMVSYVSYHKLLAADQRHAY